MDDIILKEKRILLVAPKYLGIYQDLIDALHNFGCMVESVIYVSNPNDPFYISSKKTKVASKEEVLEEYKSFWNSIISSGNYSLMYDYLLVIDGTNMHATFIDTLRKKNPNLKAVNYIFDGIETVYRFDRCFDCYDKIYTFDLGDSAKFNIKHMPIFWVPVDGKYEVERDIFGMGAYNVIRRKVYGEVQKKIRGKGISSYLKLYRSINTRPLGKVKCIIKDVIDLPYITMITHKALSTSEFRKMILTSRIIVDTSNGYQDGLSARFMWALGLRKKIITNNISVKQYPFYSSQQILIFDWNDDNLINFIRQDLNIDDKISSIIDRYRIDNWLMTLLY